MESVVMRETLEREEEGCCSRDVRRRHRGVGVRMQWEWVWGLEES